MRSEEKVAVLPKKDFDEYQFQLQAFSLESM